MYCFIDWCSIFTILGSTLIIIYIKAIWSFFLYPFLILWYISDGPYRKNKKINLNYSGLYLEVNWETPRAMEFKPYVSEKFLLFVGKYWCRILVLILGFLYLLLPKVNVFYTHTYTIYNKVPKSFWRSMQFLFSKYSWNFFILNTRKLLLCWQPFAKHWIIVEAFDMSIKMMLIWPFKSS